MKKYGLFPGYVISKNDRDRHYVSAYTLVQLYGVSLEECVLEPKGNHGLIELRPKFNGDYSLPETQKPA